MIDSTSYYGSVSLAIAMGRRLPFTVTATEGVFHGHYYYGCVSGDITMDRRLPYTVTASGTLNDRLFP